MSKDFAVQPKGSYTAMLPKGWYIEVRLNNESLVDFGPFHPTELMEKLDELESKFKFTKLKFIILNYSQDRYK